METNYHFGDLILLKGTKVISQISLVAFLYLVLASCDKRLEGPDAATQEAFGRYIASIAPLNMPNKMHKVVLIIPSSGCSGCIEKAIDFSKGHLRNDNFRLILSGRQMKSIRNRHSDLVGNPKVVFDTKAVAIEMGIVDAFPMAFFLTEDGLISTMKLDGLTIDEDLGLITEHLNE